MDKFTKLRGLLSKSMNASPKSWRSFFRKYGLPATVSCPEKRIVALYQQHGNVVLKDINDILTQGEMSAFSGEVLDRAGSIFDTGGDIIDIIKGYGSSKNTESDSDVSATVKNRSDEEKRTKIMIGVFAGLCIVSILAVVIIRKINN